MSRVGKFAIHLKPDGTFDLLKLTPRMDAHEDAGTLSPRRTDAKALNVELRDGGMLIVVDSGRLIPVVEAITGVRSTILPPRPDPQSTRAELTGRIMKAEDAQKSRTGRRKKKQLPK